MKMTAKSFVIFIFLLFFCFFSAVNVFPGWFKHYGGSGDDSGDSIQQTSDGGYIVAGYTLSFSYGNYDLAIYKLNSSGNKQWFKHYGGANDESGNSIQQTSDGGYIVAGDTTSYTYGSSDFAIYKLDSNGNKTWFKHYGGANTDKAQSIQQTSDGGFIVTGYTSSYTYGIFDISIYRLDSSGNKVWFKHYGGGNNDYGFSIQQTSDGGFVVGGYTASYTHGNFDFAIYKLDSNGNKIWFKHYGGAYNDIGRSIQQTSDGGYIVAGYTKSFTYGDNDFAIYKLDSNGNQIWFKHYGGTDSDVCYSIQQTSDGSYITAGYTDSYANGSYDFALYRLNSTGSKIWFKHYGGTYDDRGKSIQQTSEGGYIVSGSSFSYSYGSGDFAIYKLDSNGDK